MAHRLIVAATFAALLHGSMTFYTKNVMERVYRNQLDYGHVQPCPRCIGKIAIVDRQYLGWHAYITVPGGTIEGPFLVTDTAQLAHAAALRRRGIIGEFDWPTAQRLGMRGPLEGVTVFLMEAHR